MFIIPQDMRIVVAEL